TQAEINIGAYFLESEDGQDWYECQSLFSDDTAKIMYDPEGVIDPAIIHLLSWVGAAYILWLAWKIATSPAADENARPKPVGF
ncbi:hypothetical protein ONO12_28515, partial [Salmonella enterica subsp. enterica serovar Montevideo]|nr:hypothetical protein [Salmonella enterica subsp. enterica serovar Montevideo]